LTITPDLWALQLYVSTHFVSAEKLGTEGPGPSLDPKKLSSWIKKNFPSFGDEDASKRNAIPTQVRAGLTVLNQQVYLRV
jgi:hypothetical protein